MIKKKELNDKELVEKYGNEKQNLQKAVKKMIVKKPRKAVTGKGKAKD